MINYELSLSKISARRKIEQKATYSHGTLYQNEVNHRLICLPGKDLGAIKNIKRYLRKIITAFKFWLLSFRPLRPLFNNNYYPCQHVFHISISVEIERHYSQVMATLWGEWPKNSNNKTKQEWGSFHVLNLVTWQRFTRRDETWRTRRTKHNEIIQRRVVETNRKHTCPFHIHYQWTASIKTLSLLIVIQIELSCCILYTHTAVGRDVTHCQTNEWIKILTIEVHFIHLTWAMNENANDHKSKHSR